MTREPGDVRRNGADGRADVDAGERSKRKTIKTAPFQVPQIQLVPKDVLGAESRAPLRRRMTKTATPGMS